MKNISSLLKNPLFTRIVLIVVVSGLLLGGTFFYLKEMQGRIYIENSLVDATVVPIAPAVPGKLRDVLVKEGQHVRKGDVLAVVGSEAIHAYEDGVIISTNKAIGAMASAQTPVIQMINPNNMRINATIDENKGLNQLKVGQVVSFTVDALPGRLFWGWVDEISPTAKQTSLSFSISSERPTQQFVVYIRYNTGAHPEIKNGMSAKVVVYTDSL